MVRRARLVVPVAVMALAGLGIGAGGAPRAEAAARFSCAGWEMLFGSTPTDGLRASSVRYHGRSVARAISVPEIRVFYSAHHTMNDQLGGSGNIAFHGIVRRCDGRTGSLRATYSQQGWPGNGTYRYDVSYDVTRDGGLFPYVSVYGPGLEPRAVYHAFWRLDLDVDGNEPDRVERHGGAWSEPSVEVNFGDDDSHDSAGQEWRFVDESSARAVSVAPPDADNATFYVLQTKLRGAGYGRTGEGSVDLKSPLLPSVFDQNETVRGVDQVAWYWARHAYRRPARCPGAGCAAAAVVLGPRLRAEGY